METNISSVIAIVFLVIAIALGFIKGMNSGVISMALALVACLILNIENKDLLAGFPVNMFLILFGTMFLFGIAKSLGTMNLLAKKVIALVGNSSWLLPWAMFLLTLLISAIGAGPAPSIAIVALPAISLAIELGVSPFLFGVMVALGGDAGAASPISTAGLVASSLTQDFGWRSLQPTYFINSIIGHIIVALACYLLLRGWKIKPKKKMDSKDLPKFNKSQKMSLAGIIIFAICAGAIKLNVGLIALAIGIFLIIINIGVSDEEVINSISWSTLLLICGVSLLMNIVKLTGGIDLIIAFLSGFMNASTAKPIMALSAGIMSLFSTTTSVVMPTLIPTLPGILEQIGHSIDGVTLMSALTNGSFSAAISPMSAGGGIVLSTYISLTSCDEKEQQNMFKKLILIALFCICVMVIVAALPIYL